jgi:hypothetical protein
MRKYDPDKAPNPREWLALDEQERMNLVKRYHRQEGDYGESLDMHTVFHTVVETQLAEKHAPVKAAYLRLRKGGLNRHEAIHAIGSVLAEHVWGVVNEDKLEPDANEAYFAALDELTVESWHEAYRDQD